MANLYADTSALVKRYAAEVGSAWLTALVDPASGHDVFSHQITAVEMIAALYLKARTGAITPADAQRADAVFRLDWQRQYQILEVSTPVIERAMQLVRQHGLRGYDAVHVAAALELDRDLRADGSTPLIFISADQDQLRAASAHGLAVDDPNAHP